MSDVKSWKGETVQTSIPVPDAQAELGPCRWCGEPSITEIEIEKERYRNDRGVRIVAKAALMAPVCKYHAGILDRQEQQPEPVN